MSSPAADTARGFTLVEVMVAALLGGLVLVGVLTTNLQVIRSGVRLTQYAEMEAQVRRGLDQLGRDLRIASGITWNGTSDITLTVPTSSGSTRRVTYAWTSSSQSLFQVAGTDSTVTAGRIYLVRGIAPLANGDPGLTFNRFDRDGNAAATDLATKRIQVSLTVGRQAGVMAAATENNVSATFTLRNKPTS